MIVFGKPKHSSEITLEDCREHPVWTSAQDARHDEEWEKPIVSTSEITDEVLRDASILPIILLQIEGTQTYATGCYLHSLKEVFAISVWNNDRWQELERVKGLEAPLVFVAVPPIAGQAGVRFRCADLHHDKAVQIPATDSPAAPR